MEDIADKLAQLLSSNDGIDKIQSIAKTLFSDNSDAESCEPEYSNAENNNDDSFDFPPGFDPIKLMNIVSAFSNGQSDKRSQLLLALKPHLSEERGQRVDKAVKLLKIAALLPLLKEQGLLDLL